MTERLARASSRRPWLVVGLWLIVILTSVVHLRARVRARLLTLR